jgi:hypothetical protein
MNESSVIILTSGLSGSSVVSNLISRTGYWTGEETWKKNDYDTHENAVLVNLNMRLLETIRYQGNYTRHVDHDALERIKAIDPIKNHSEYVKFVSSCNMNSPWIWKDPRLWITIPFWDRILDNNIKYIHLDRSLLQRWISVNSRRQIQSFCYLKKHINHINQNISAFLIANKKKYLYMNFDDLITKPEEMLVELNNFLGTHLDKNDLISVYNKPLYKKNRGVMDFAKASAIYLKNYKARYKY